TLGHTDVVHVDGGDRPGAAQRREGYLEGMRAHGLADRIEVLPGDYTVESGVAAARALAERDRLPTAVVAGNDLCACGVVESFVRTGVRTPEDLSVVGYDDSRTASLPYLDLTTVRQDTGRMAEIAVRAAVERLGGGRTDDRVDVLEPTLILRSSTAPAAGREGRAVRGRAAGGPARRGCGRFGGNRFFQGDAQRVPARGGVTALLPRACPDERPAQRGLG